MVPSNVTHFPGEALVNYVHTRLENRTVKDF